MHTYMHACMHTYVCICLHTYIRTYLIYITNNTISIGVDVWGGLAIGRGQTYVCSTN